jgi:hypothetical protein
MSRRGLVVVVSVLSLSAPALAQEPVRFDARRVFACTEIKPPQQADSSRKVIVVSIPISANFGVPESSIERLRYEFRMPKSVTVIDHLPKTRTAGEEKGSGTEKRNRFLTPFPGPFPGPDPFSRPRDKFIGGTGLLTIVGGGLGGAATGGTGTAVGLSGAGGGTIVAAPAVATVGIGELGVVAGAGVGVGGQIYQMAATNPGASNAGAFLTPDEFENAVRQLFGGKPSGEVNTSKGLVEIDSVTSEFATQAKRITSPQGAAKFSGSNATQFERTVAYAQAQGLNVRYAITEQVQVSWIQGLLAKAKAIGAASGNNPITEIHFAVVDSRTGQLIRTFVRPVPG